MELNFKTLKVEIRDQIATIKMIPYEKTLNEPRIDLHWDIGECISRLRGNNKIRLIVLEGDEDRFLTTPTREWQSSELGMEYVASPAGAWLTFTGIIRTHMEMAEIEKPIIAKVNGDAVGFGASLAMASDIIIASSEANVCHMHMSMGELDEIGPEYALVPGDGALQLIPMFLTPTQAKEYLMLGPLCTAQELKDLGIINHVVSPEDLDAKVEHMCERLLSRSAYALAWTKRVANRALVNHLNMTADAAVGYEMVTALQIERENKGVKPGHFKERFTLD